jgi:hypothetical protein
MYILYNNLNDSLNDLNKQQERLTELITVLNLQKSLGLIIDTDIVPAFQMSLQQAQTRLKDIELGIAIINDNKGFAVRELNYMLGQDASLTLNIQGLPKPDYVQINKIDFNADYIKAVGNSFEVRLQDATDSDADMMHDAQRAFNAGFNKVYNAVVSSKITLENTKVKLLDEEKIMTIVKLKYDLGIASKLEYDMENYTLAAAEAAVKTDEANLFKAYRDYQWAMQGLLPAAPAPESTSTSNTNSNS